MKAPRAVPAPVWALPALSAVAGLVALVLAPQGTRGWTAAVTVTAWVILAAALATAHRLVRQAQRTATERIVEADRLKASTAALEADAAHTSDVALPAVVRLVRGGWNTAAALDQVPPPRSQRHRKLLHIVAATVEEQGQQAASFQAANAQLREELGTEIARLREELEAMTAQVERFTRETLPSVTARLRAGETGASVRAETVLPDHPLLRTSAESVVRELALSERRALAAQTASAKALSRVQAKAVSMLADLRSMQERHGEEVFGDLLKLDHSTSQLGLMTDRLALLMGGRPSRAWNRPIVMESILRGAVGRIAAYQRVRLHCSSTAAISGFAAESVMHLLAELMDNAANFSPPIDEVHVYVEERGTGIVVTIEDSGLKMADAAMRRAADSVSGRLTDLATLQGTRLGLAVVGQLALKHRISVNYRPSSRGGTGVVVLLPRQLIAQQNLEDHQSPGLPTTAATLPNRPPAAAASVPPPATSVTPPAGTALRSLPAPATPPDLTPVPLTPPDHAPAAHGPSDHLPEYVREPARPVEPVAPPVRPAAPSTPNGLPVRTPGRTMGEAERERGRHRAAPASPSPADGGAPKAPPRTAAQQFGAFQRGRRPQADPAAPDGPAAPPPGAP
ncbi:MULTISPECIES: ATP-binding protein [unclassified Streptomyces]|nr:MULTISPECIES: ATP-binding protein [unclassified Streptomyces]MYT98092.1 ATP-binding protein [Streptomyces sp. SID8350]SCK34923.1 Signal transduction histidine kinase [Streptomyces sp. AmelKG-D3]